MQNRKNEFRIFLNQKEAEELEKIRNENPGLQTNHDIYKTLVNSYLTKNDKQLHELRQLKLDVNTLLEILGQLMLEGVGFKNKQGTSIFEVNMGSKFVGVLSARKKVLNRIQEAQQKRASH